MSRTQRRLEAGIEGWLTKREAAKFAGVSTRTITNWEARGAFLTANVIMPGATRGRKLIDRASLREFIAGFIGVETTAAICKSKTEDAGAREAE